MQFYISEQFLSFCSTNYGSIFLQFEILPSKAAMSSKIISIHLSSPAGEAKSPQGTALTQGVLLGRCTQRDNIAVHNVLKKVIAGQ